MTLRARVRRLWKRWQSSVRVTKLVTIRNEPGLAMEWETPTALLLRVAAGSAGDPAAALSDCQRSLIGPGDMVVILGRTPQPARRPAQADS